VDEGGGFVANIARHGSCSRSWWDRQIFCEPLNQRDCACNIDPPASSTPSCGGHALPRREQWARQGWSRRAWHRNPEL